MAENINETMKYYHQGWNAYIFGDPYQPGFNQSWRDGWRDCRDAKPEDRKPFSEPTMPSEQEWKLAPVPTKDLVTRCEEVLEWHRTAILRDGAIRELAKSMPHSVEHQKLRAAEDKTAVEAMQFVIAASQPQPPQDVRAPGDGAARIGIEILRDQLDRMKKREDISDDHRQGFAWAIDRLEHVALAGEILTASPATADDVAADAERRAQNAAREAQRMAAYALREKVRADAAEADRDRLAEIARDCRSYLKYEIGGEAQRTGLIGEIDAALTATKQEAGNVE